MKEIEIPFGAKDSELKGWEYTIPEGMEAEIKDGKIVVREKQPAERFEEAREKYRVEWSKEEAAEEYVTTHLRNNEFPTADCAFIAGAEWQASQMPMPEDTVLFNKGVAEGRRLERDDMLGDAEECELYWDGDFLAIDLNMVALGYSEKDKVKVIVLKDESK